MNTLLYFFHRNLSGNPLLDLQNVKLTNLFPKLTILDVSGNPHWLNRSHVINHYSMLQIIRGTPLDGMCLRCFFVKQDVIINHDVTPWYDDVSKEMTYAIRHPILKYSGCYGNIISFKDKYYQEFVSLGYNLSCVSRDERCFRGYKKLSFFQNYDVTPLNQCWEKMNTSSLFLVVLVTVAVAMNMTVVIVTARAKVLRENVACCLIGSVAVGDLTMAFYLLVIIATRAALSYRQMMELLETKFCHFVGFLFINSQGISAFTSFIVSLERYLAVVYCIRPNVRIFPDTAKACGVAIFIFSFIFAILPYTVLSKFYVPDSHCVPVSDPTGGYIEYMMIPGGVVMVLYFSTIPLYIHMYRSVKRSSQMVGIKRESSVARKISFVVLSNMGFFFMPLLILTLVNVTPLGTLFPIQDKQIFWKTFMYYSFACNTCLNPSLFAFRNEKFRFALKQQLHIVPNNRVCPATNVTNTKPVKDSTV